MKIIYELDTEKDDQDTIEMMYRASDYRSALWEIDSMLRNVLKHGDGKAPQEMCEEIRRIIAETGL